MSVNLNKLCSLNGVACIAVLVVELLLFCPLLKSQHVGRMAAVFFSKVSVINKCLMIFEMILISSSALLPRIFSSNEVIFISDNETFCCVVDQKAVLSLIPLT